MSSHFRIKTLILVLLLFSIVPNLYAQENVITLSGKITDSETRKPVPFANVGIAGKNIGTVSNNAGEFIFKVPASYRQDSLKISCIGYQTYMKPISALVDSPITITLKPATFALEEVLVQARRKSAVDILKEAIAAIPTNYDTSATQLTAFYKEETRLGNEEIISLEQVLEAKRPSLTSKELDDQIQTVKERRKKIDHSKDTHFYIWLQLNGGAKNALKSGDPIRFYKKKHKYSILNEKNFKHYQVNLQNIISDGSRSMYVIEMLPKKKSRKALAQGKFYLDRQTLAFVRWEFELTQNGLDLENNHRLLLKKVGEMIIKANLKLSYFKETVNFENYNNKWYVKDVKRDFEAKVNSKSRNMEDYLWKTNLQLTVTEIKRLNQSLPAENVNASEGAAYKTRPAEKEDTFWENYNIIKPAAVDTSGVFKESSDSTYTYKQRAKQSAGNTASNRENGFTRADTLRGQLTPLRTCYDVSFYDLAIKVDIGNKFISGSNTIRFLVTEPFRRMQVDLYANMEIHKILYKEKELSYTREFNAVFVDFPEQLQPETVQEITVFYSGKPKEPNRDIPMDGGFLWDKDAAGNPWVQVVCQGSGASLWWPSKDHLSDEPDSVRIAVTVPAELMNISNGRLRKTTRLPGNWTKYEWFVSYPINNYNVTLNIGKYAHLQDVYITDDTLTLDYYAMPYHLEKAQVIFSQVKPILATLEKHYGKYPFPRDGFTLMESLYPMEHQSAVSFGKIPEGEIRDSLDAPMSLVWHEVAHEWWGNNVSCRDLADMWLHEAFAEYTERLYLMRLLGEEGEQAYMESLPDRVVGKEPIVGVPGVNHIHYDIEDMYSKGALVLHTFRHVLSNDTLWAEILLGIQQDFRYKTITTDELVAYINTKTNTDYTYFFDQYLKYATLPKLMLKLAEKGQSLVVQYKWAADVQDFRMPVHITTAMDTYTCIRPTTSWQTVALPNLSYDDFEVDEEKFYVEVEIVE